MAVYAAIQVPDEHVRVWRLAKQCQTPGSTITGKAFTVEVDMLMPLVVGNGDQEIANKYRVASRQLLLTHELA